MVQETVRTTQRKNKWASKLGGHCMGTTGRKWAKKRKQAGSQGEGIKEIRSKQKSTVAPPKGLKHSEASAR